MRRIFARIGIVILLLALLCPVQSSVAATTGPLKQTYNGHLLNSSGQAITTAHSVRFSYWKSADYASTDTTATGALNTGTSNYGSWHEVQSVTPNNSGYFSVELGSVRALPDLSSYTPATLSGLYLQVEVKEASAADTAYELLDTNGSDSTIDRSHVTSVPFALNADKLDQRDTGTSSGSIAVLGSGGLMPLSTVPGGTNRDSFTVDNDNSATSEIALTFGATLAEKLKFDVANSRFTFTDDLRVEGDLTVTGLINGVDITAIQNATGALKVASGGGLNLQISGGSYRLNGNITNATGTTSALTANATNYVFFGSGGLMVRTTSFPIGQSYIPLAQVTTNTGSVLSITDRRVLQSDDREQTIEQVYHAGFEHATYQGDGGGDNVGQLFTTHDNTNLKNFYEWTSTRTTLQDYDVILRVTLDSDFVRWTQTSTTNPITFTYRSTSADAANNKLNVQAYDTNGTPVTLSGSTTNLANTSWTTGQIEFTGTPTWTAGQELLLRFKLSAKDSYQMHLGDLNLRYVKFIQE